MVSRLLREDWGFKRLLWVYSGRRGVHLWVCDRKAMLMEDSERQQLIRSLVGFRLLGQKEVSTWRSGGTRVDEDRLRGGKLVERMRRPIGPAFR